MCLQTHKENPVLVTEAVKVVLMAAREISNLFEDFEVAKELWLNVAWPEQMKLRLS